MIYVLHYTSDNVSLGVTLHSSIEHIMEVSDQFLDTVVDGGPTLETQKIKDFPTPQSTQGWLDLIEEVRVKYGFKMK